MRIDIATGATTATATATACSDGFGFEEYPYCTKLPGHFPFQSETMIQGKWTNSMYLMLQKFFNVSRTGVSDMYAHVSTRFNTSCSFYEQWTIKFIDPIAVLRVEWVVHLIIKEWWTGKY